MDISGDGSTYQAFSWLTYFLVAFVIVVWDKFKKWDKS